MSGKAEQDPDGDAAAPGPGADAAPDRADAATEADEATDGTDESVDDPAATDGDDHDGDDDGDDDDDHDDHDDGDHPVAEVVGDQTEVGDADSAAPPEEPAAASDGDTAVDPDPALVAADATGTTEADAEQDAPAPSPTALRVDYGAHLEANYARLVAQLYAITLDAGEAHDVVQDAYSRAWRQWEDVGRSPDPAGWVRRVAVRSTIRSWRRAVARLGLDRSARPLDEDTDPRTRALLGALGRLPAPERRAVVLFHMAGVPAAEIAAVERVSLDAVYDRLHRARNVVIEGMADVLTAVLGTDEELEYR